MAVGTDIFHLMLSTQTPQTNAKIPDSSNLTPITVQPKLTEQTIKEQ